MNNKKTSKLAVKILIPTLIVVVLATMWVFKTKKDHVFNAEQASIPVDFALKTDTVDLDKLKEYKMPIIFDFGADACVPCQEMAPTLKKVNADMQGKAIIKYVDIWKNPSLGREFPIRVIPTQLIFNADGTPYVPSEKVKINFEIFNYKDSGEHALTIHQGILTEEQMKEILKDMGV